MKKNKIEKNQAENNRIDLYKVEDCKANKYQEKKYPSKITLYYSIIIISIMMLLAACSKDVERQSDIQTAAVTVLPQEAFVKAVAGDLVNVVTLVPPGASPENYQPTPKQMADFAQADLYFTIGMSSEESNILPGAASLNKNLKVISLTEYVDAVYPARYFEEEPAMVSESKTDNQENVAEEEHIGRDPHMWMSPKRVILMIQVIKDQLIVQDPKNSAVYETNAAAYIKELEGLDEELKSVFSQMASLKFVIMHPSLGYFADDYGLTMIALEQGGKTSSAAHMQSIIDYARENNIKVIFYQAEFDSQQAETLAKEIDGKTMALEVLSPDYLNNMREMLQIFKDTL